MIRTLTTIGAIAVACSAFAAGDGAGDAQRGAYLARIMDCQGCHSGRTPQGALDPAQTLTGGTVGFELPGLGIFWPPNLTPSPEALGGWTDEQVDAALRKGQRPDGRQLAPIMPWESDAALTDADVADLVAYLRTLPPSANRMPAPMPAGGNGPAPFFRVVPPSGAPKS